MNDLYKIARELFEARLSPVLSQEGSFDADGDFVYNDDWVQGAWIGFRAALFTAPPGWKLVPVVPTPMMIATFRADNEHGALSWMTHTALRCADFGSRYAGMLAAAPEAK